MHYRGTLFFLARHLLALGLVIIGAWSTMAQASLDELSNRLAEFEPLSGGELGVGVIDIETGERINIRGDVRFPMASTFKIAVAIKVLKRVDSGELHSEQMIDISRDRYIASSVITDLMPHGGVSMSVANLLELMMVESDNTATDILVELAGGPGEITEWLRSAGIKEQRVDRDTAGLLGDFYGIPAGRPFLDKVEMAEAQNPDIWHDASGLRPSYDDDPRDTTTPAAMATLLYNLFQGKYLEPESTQLLVGAMERCRTGEDRIKGLLPVGSRVAHKTGTLGATSNDVGVMTLPGGRQVVLAVYVKKSELPVAQRARAIAEVARTVFDYFSLR